MKKKFIIYIIYVPHIFDYFILKQKFYELRKFLKWDFGRFLDANILLNISMTAIARTIQNRNIIFLLIQSQSTIRMISNNYCH